MNNERIKQLINRHRLTFAITAVVVIALIMTSISMSLYITSGTSSLDLSRPGYTQVREQINAGSGVSFSENGPLNADVMKDFTKLFDSQKNTITTLDGFSDPSLEDASLQLD